MVIPSIKTILAGTLTLAAGVGSLIWNMQPANAEMIGGGGTCTPHQISYQKFIPGHYNQDGTWVNSHYVTRYMMSTECNQPPSHPFVLQPGTWFSNASGFGLPTEIIQLSPNTYRLINEQGSVSQGYQKGNKIVAPDWNVTGFLENNGNRIAWSNGTTWSRTQFFFN